ncbi:MULTISPECIES: hypothetical protein [unclassified Streptomyces]|uniref:hypothetical protein n=1 Tax=unclassified Streptomyces TaxID=2593676 RepID=UPI002256719E|nr:hypothetical protein [Streptomyces sp. NBC_01551]MCX4528575.1 hypothetical protein [Streptomyces sp. NBC_01551]
MTQIAGTSLATVAAALLASKLGVYGTILGAGVVSVVATAGGPVIQHLFRRTGDQLRETAKPRARQAPAADGFGEATVHGTRVRGWKRTAVASGAAFAIAVGGLGAYEAAAGTSVSKDGGTIFSAGTRKAPDAEPGAERDPGRRAPPPQQQQGSGGEGGKSDSGDKGGETPGSGSGSSPGPSRSPGGRSPGPGPSPSGSGEPPTTPGPSTSGPAPTGTPKPTPPAPPAPAPEESP